jgi:hypothetical protein
MLNTPPLQRSAGFLSMANETQRLDVRRIISEWNRRLLVMAVRLRRQHPDLALFVYDAHSAWDAMLDATTSTGITNVEGCASGSASHVGRSPLVRVCNFAGLTHPIAREATVEGCPHAFGAFFWADPFRTSAFRRPPRLATPLIRVQTRHGWCTRSWRRVRPFCVHQEPDLSVVQI